MLSLQIISLCHGSIQAGVAPQSGRWWATSMRQAGWLISGGEATG